MKMGNGKKENNRKSGAAAAAKDKRRAEAVERQAAYNALATEEKLERAGKKERAKILAKIPKVGEKNAKSDKSEKRTAKTDEVSGSKKS